MNNQKIFEVYKPFRNKLRYFNLIDSLYLLWVYSSNYTFNNSFPYDIEKLDGFNPHETKLLQRQCYGGLFDHEIDFLLKEIIINCDIAKTKYTLREKKHLIPLINYLRGALLESVNAEYSIRNNPLLELNRLFHTQFKWQSKINTNTIFRYYKIYSQKSISELIYNKVGLTPLQIFLIGFLLCSFFSKEFKIPLVIDCEIPNLNYEMIKKFLNFFAVDIENAKRELKNYQEINENIFHSYNPLQATPILIYNDNIFCPIPVSIYFQITYGIYYLIVKEKGFDKTGIAFENYVEEVSKRIFTNSNIKIIRGEVYKDGKKNKEEKQTTDLIITDQDSIMFVECKFKRMTLASKFNLDITVERGLENDLKIMAHAIRQLYKTYLDYKNDKYKTIKFDYKKKFYPIVVTLEDWYININPFIRNKLEFFIVEKFNEENLDISLITEFPYYIYSASEFETHIQIINYLGIKDYFHRLANHTIDQLLIEYPYINIYEGEYERTFVDPFLS